METTVNIGLNVNGVRELTATKILSTLRVEGVNIIRWEVKESHTELTLVAEIAEPLSPRKGYGIAVLLHQDAIAQLDGEGNGDLFGPQAEKWKPFNPAYFLTL